METDYSEILRKEFNSIKNDLVKAYDRKGMRASGKFEEELEVEVRGNYALLIGAHYSQQLELGRKAGKFPPIKAIENWIYDKNLDSRIDGEISVKSLAFLIARKIAKEGWNRGGDINLISEVITVERIDKIIQKVGEVVVIDFTTDIINLLEEIKN